MTKNKMAFAEMVWDNYDSLGNNPIQTMAIIWDEFAHGALAGWALQEHGITESELLEVMTTLTKEMRHMDLSKSAMERSK